MPKVLLSHECGGVFHNRRIFSSFIVDCSYNNPINALTPDCRRLRELFNGKEVLGGDLKCEEPDISPFPGRPKKIYPEREVYVHDTQTDLWYHCCEHRMLGGKFSTDAPVPRLPQSMGLGFLPFEVGGLLSKEPPKPPHHYDGPLFQCTMQQNLKHVQHSNGGRKAVKELPGTAFALANPLAGKIRCGGDHGVALSKYAGGTQIGMADIGLANQTSGGCIDTGPHHSSTIQGKPYAVYELMMSPAELVVAGMRRTSMTGCEKRDLARFF